MSNAKDGSMSPLTPVPSDFGSQSPAPEIPSMFPPQTAPTAEDTVMEDVDAPAATAAPVPDNTSTSRNPTPDKAAAPVSAPPVVPAPAPETPQPETPQPETAAPETAASETAEPETAQPETAASETAEPEIAQPETAVPEPAEPETAAPEPAARPARKQASGRKRARESTPENPTGATGRMPYIPSARETGEIRLPAKRMRKDEHAKHMNELIPLHKLVESAGSITGQRVVVALIAGFERGEVSGEARFIVSAGVDTDVTGLPTGKVTYVIHHRDLDGNQLTGGGKRTNITYDGILDRRGQFLGRFTGRTSAEIEKFCFALAAKVAKKEAGLAGLPFDECFATSRI